MIVVSVLRDIYDGNWTVITSDVTKLVFTVNCSVASLIEFTVVVVGRNWTLDSKFGTMPSNEAEQLDIGLPFVLAAIVNVPWGIVVGGV